VLLSLLLSPLVGLLERIRVPRAAAAVVTVFSCLAVVWYLGSYLYAPAQQWLDTAPAQIDELREKFRVLLHPVERMQSATEKVAEAAKPNNANPPPREVVVERQSLLGLLNDTQAFVVGTLATLILLFFLLASGDLFLRKLIRVIPRFSDKIVAVEITRTIQHQIGRYFLGATMINIVLGIVVTGAMMLLGMPTPALLGTIAALLNFIPYIGSGLMLVITAIVAVITFDTVSEMLLPPLVFLVLTTIEGQVVQPIVHGRRLNSTPVVLFTWVLF
jgi:predicted PurR-regulated permease PerM